MKKIVMAALLGVALVSCDGKSQGNQVKSNGLPKASETKAATGVLGGVAYVEIDSLSTQYQYCKDQLAALEAKQKNYAASLQKEAQALSSLAAQIQKNLQEGKYKNEQEYKNAMAAGQRQQETYDKHQEQYANEMQNATVAYQKELRKRLNEFLAEYNKDGRYSLVLTNSEGAVNVLYAAPALDITKDVIEGLNKAYKK